MFGPRMPPTGGRKRFDEGPRFQNDGGGFFDGPRGRFMPPDEPMFRSNMPPEMFDHFDGPRPFFDGPPPGFHGPHGPPRMRPERLPFDGPRPPWDIPPHFRPGPPGPRGHPRNVRPPWRFEGSNRRLENGKTNGNHQEKSKTHNIFDDPEEPLFDNETTKTNGKQTQEST